MMMVPYNQEKETEILHQKKLTEAFFNNLFDQLKINENHQKEQESFLLEMYLSHINLKLKGKNSDLKFKEFINIIVIQRKSIWCIQSIRGRDSDKLFCCINASKGIICF